MDRKSNTYATCPNCNEYLYGSALAKHNLADCVQALKAENADLNLKLDIQTSMTRSVLERAKNLVKGTIVVDLFPELAPEVAPEVEDGPEGTKPDGAPGPKKGKA